MRLKNNNTKYFLLNFSLKMNFIRIFIMASYKRYFKNQQNNIINPILCGTLKI